MKRRELKAQNTLDRLEETEFIKDVGKTDGRKKRHPIRGLFLGLFAVFMIVLIGGYFLFDVPSWQTLDVTKITNLKQTGKILDADGNFIATLRGTENRTVITLNTLPKHVTDAFLAAEDLRFYQHQGFDLIRIFGAVAANLKSQSFSEGASTISQQLIKLSHLSTQKTIGRKLEEIWLSVQLESQYTKDQILEMYLNYIYFGRGAYGIQAAAQAYFEKNANELTIAQAAALAAIIKAPSLYAPHLKPENNRARREYILSVMRENEMISVPDYDAAMAEEIIPSELQAEETKYGWYLDAVLDEAESVLGIGSEALLGSGYTIFTELSQEQQALIDEKFTDKSLFPANASDGTLVQGAMASVDVNTGAVRAVVGGREYHVQRGLNRATQMRRQPGSALKPLAVYAPAMEYAGWTAAGVLNDTPTAFGKYSPRNSGNKYYGYVTVRTALKYSLNIPAVSLMNLIGVENARNYMLKCGIPLDDRDYNLALALGAMTYGVSPVQLASAYSPFANGGYYYEPYFISSIADANGNIIYRHEVQGERVLSEQNAAIMTNLLQSVTSSGTGAKLSGAGTPVAGKTGTVNMTGTSGNRDIWMAAYNSQISTAFWMGFDEPDTAHKLSSWVSGGDYTAALATQFFKNLYKNKNKPAFKSASGLVWLEIDKKSIEWTGEAMLSSDLTPSAYRFSEVFSSRNRPTKTSNVWTAPRSPSSFYVTHNDSGNPVLVITASDTALFRIQRDAVGESIILTELSGQAGNTLYYADTRAKVGVTYTYRVIPIHQELINNGVLLEGKQAVQIAQAKWPTAGEIINELQEYLFGER